MGNDKERINQEHNERMKKIEIDNYEKELREKEQEAKYKRKTRMSASKIIIGAMIVLCLQIIIYAEWVMFALHDITALYVLIGVPATLSVSIWGYFSKSKAENTKNGLVYDATMLELQEEMAESNDGGPVG